MPSVKLTASGYTGLTGMSVSGSYPMTRAYEDSSDTSDYARLSISASTTGYVYLTYDASAIPANATITSVVANARLRISSSTRVTNRVCQLYTGTTAKGSSVSFSSTSNGGAVVSPTAGSWTRAELSSLRMRIGGTGSSSSQSKYIYIYGTDITVTYEEASIPVTGVALDKSTDTVAVGSTITLTATVSPSDATNKAVSWSTSNSSVATVSGGVVTGVAAGSATIAVTTTDGGYTATCAVTVTSGGGGTWTTIFDDDVQLIPDSPYNYIYYSGFSGAFEANTTYRVTWDGVTYTCQSQPNANTYDGCSVGNLALGAGGTDTGEPFLLYRAFWDSTVLTADTTSDAGEYGRWIHCKIEKLSGGNPPPVITVGTPSQTAISAITGHDQCVCTFTSDLALQQWEARATKAGVTPARGVGLLVESGGALAANTQATIYIENEELTQGDGEYTITVYGQSTDGVWSA